MIIIDARLDVLPAAPHLSLKWRERRKRGERERRR